MQSLAELRVCFAPGLRLHSFHLPEGFYRAVEVPKWSLILWVGEGKLPPERCSQENGSLLLRHWRARNVCELAGREYKERNGF